MTKQNNNSSPSMIMDDYGTRYEQILLHQRELESYASALEKKKEKEEEEASLSSSMNDPTHKIDQRKHHCENSFEQFNKNNSCTTTATDDYANIATAMTMNQIAMTGMLKSAILVKSEQLQEDDDKQHLESTMALTGLMCLFDDTLQEQHFGKRTSTRQKIKNSTKSTSSAYNIDNDPVTKFWTLSTIEQLKCKRIDNATNTNTTNTFYTTSNNNYANNYNEEQLNADVDAFFDFYPECRTMNQTHVIHRYTHEIQPTSNSASLSNNAISSNSNSNGISHDHDHRGKRNKNIKCNEEDDAVIKMNNNNNTNAMINNTQKHQMDDHHQQQRNKIVKNPYASSSSAIMKSNQSSSKNPSSAPISTSTTISSPSHTLSSWDAYDAKHSNRGLTNHTVLSSSRNPNLYNGNNGGVGGRNELSHHRQSNANNNSNRINNNDGDTKISNPFCTANELDKNKIERFDRCGDDNNDNVDEYYNEGRRYNASIEYNNHNGNMNNNRHHHQQNHNTYGVQQQKLNQWRNNQQQRQQTQNEEQMHQYNPNRPTLSAGLKRKFQTPKLGLGNTASKGSSNSSNNSKNNINGSRNRNSNSARTNNNQVIKGNNNKTTNDNDDEDQDDLPEELKGLDKDLISKIENEIVDSGDPITFHDIAGLEDAKQTVLELVCWPMKRPDLFTGLRRGPNGLLLFGPPGTGKTLIGKAIAHESGATFFSISSSSLTSKWIGEGEKLVRTLFAVAAYREPSVVFIDEIDSLLTQRKADENEASRRIKTEFLVQLDGTGTSGQGRVLAIGATNRPNELDDAARRRFVKRLYIPLPEQQDRVILLNTLLTKNKHGLTEKEIFKIAIETNGFSGADLKALCTDAALGPIRELGSKALEVNANDVPPISYRHFKRALHGMNPSVAQADLDLYKEWNATYGSKSLTAEDYLGLSDDEDTQEECSEDR